MFHTYVVSVLSGCCICLQWFSSVFQVGFASVSDVCFKCFICLLLYVASIVSVCSKVDQVLYMGFAWEAGGGASDPHARTWRGPVWPRKQALVGASEWHGLSRGRAKQRRNRL